MQSTLEERGFFGGSSTAGWPSVSLATPSPRGRAARGVNDAAHQAADKLDAAIRAQAEVVLNERLEYNLYMQEVRAMTPGRSVMLEKIAMTPRR